MPEGTQVSMGGEAYNIELPAPLRHRGHRAGGGAGGADGGARLHRGRRPAAAHRHHRRGHRDGADVPADQHLRHQLHHSAALGDAGAGRRHRLRAVHPLPPPRPAPRRSRPRGVRGPRRRHLRLGRRLRRPDRVHRPARARRGQHPVPHRDGHLRGDHRRLGRHHRAHLPARADGPDRGADAPQAAQGGADPKEGEQKHGTGRSPGGSASPPPTPIITIVLVVAALVGSDASDLVGCRSRCPTRASSARTNPHGSPST